MDTVLSLRKRVAPFVLSIVLVALDQWTKALVVAHFSSSTPVLRFLGDVLFITYQQNTGIAFSMGNDLPSILRAVLFIAVPLVLIVGVVVYCVREKRASVLNLLQRWSLAGIVGGGLGNLVDRAFRPNGVVDFISVKFYGLLGMERWPTFNLADSSVVVCGILLIVSSLVAERKAKALAK